VTISGGVQVSALVAVNAVGDIRDPETGKIVAGARRAPGSMDFVDSEARIKQGVRAGFIRTNTTLAVVATDAALDKVQATKMAALAQLGMARTIYPVNMMSDGDLVFALSLGKLKADLDALGVAAAEALSKAILRAVRFAPTLGGVPGLAGERR
jgi:L-aminopeptidase/D-esterase-like protein